MTREEAKRFFLGMIDALQDGDLARKDALIDERSHGDLVVIEMMAEKIMTDAGIERLSREKNRRKHEH